MTDAELTRLAADEIRESQEARDAMVRRETLVEVKEAIELIRYFQDGSHDAAMQKIIGEMLDPAPAIPEPTLLAVGAITEDQLAESAAPGGEK